MILGVSTLAGMTRATCLDDLWKGAGCMLVGGAPTIKGLPLHRLQERGVVSAAINNAAKHFRPDLWFSGDNPACYDAAILRDPGILKFAPSWHMDTPVLGAQMRMLPNIMFYVPEAKTGRPAELLEDSRNTPWYGNTLMTALALLYRFGFRTVVLCGCDFEPGADGSMYAHETQLTPGERDANIRLYSHQAEGLVGLKPVFAEAGLRLMDCSARTKLACAYRTMSFDEAVDMLAAEAGGGGNELPHGTKFASEKMKRMAGVYAPPPVEVI